MPCSGITEADTRGNHENDWARGHFWENGLKAMVPKMPFLFEPARFGKGMGNFLEMAHLRRRHHGAGYGYGGLRQPRRGKSPWCARLPRASQAPLRIIMTPIITDFLARGKSPGQAMLKSMSGGRGTRAG